MKHIARHALRALTVLSLVLFLAIAGLCLVDEWRLRREFDHRTSLSRGVIYIEDRDNDNLDFRGGTLTVTVRWLGLARTNTEVEPAPRRGRQDLTVILIWPLAIPTAVLPALWLQRLGRALKQRQKSNAATCSCCSYDLTGNVSGVCPECGSAIAKGAA